MELSVAQFVLAFILWNILLLWYMIYLVYQDYKYHEVPASVLYQSCFLSLLIHWWFIYQIWLENYIDFLAIPVWMFFLFLILEESVHVVNLFTDKYKWTKWLLWDWDKYFWFVIISFSTFVTMFIWWFLQTWIFWIKLTILPLFLVVMSLLSIIQFYILEKNKKDRKTSLFPSMFLSWIILIILNQFFNI